MTMIRKMIRAEITALGDDEVEVVMSTAALARDGHVLVPAGCDLTNYRANPIVLWSHNPDCPIGNAEDITVNGDQIAARIRFAQLGISAKADEVRGLMKTGVLRAVSVGFEPIEMEPLDPKKPRGGQRISKWELLELSPVSVPADPGAVVTARKYGDEPDMTETTAAAPEGAAPQTRAVLVVGRSCKPVFARGLYDVAQLCYLFQSLGYQLDQAKWEAAIEGDQSQVPAMLGDVLQDLGEVLLAMTAEEVAEALANYDIGPDLDADEALDTETRTHIHAAPNPATRAFRYGLASAEQRAGKVLSAETVSAMRAAMECHEEAIALHRSALRKHKEGLGNLDTLMSRATGDATSAVDENNADETAPSQNDDGGDGDIERSFDFRRRQADLLALGAR